MKKVITVIMALVMCVSLVACGGVDKQPAIDAFNEASDAFNEVATFMNENPDAFAQEDFDTMNQMADVLIQHQELLESDQEIEEEKLNEMIEWYGTVEDWATELKEAIGM